jgi:branched-subunit amino acid aminotransferase/4-amino-4-deoxychorismate lyase
MAELFELLETIKWTPDGGFFLLDRHLRRMDQSAAHFGYRCSTADLRAHLDRAVVGSSTAQRVRLLLSQAGNIRVECTPLASNDTPAALGLAASPVDPRDPFLYHKTTNRRVYVEAGRSDCDDVVLWNPERQVTESTIANIVVDMGGRKMTPPIACGLLAGTFRAELLETGAIQEAIVTLDDLRAARGIWLINSVRGWWEARLMITSG